MAWMHDGELSSYRGSDPCPSDFDAFWAERMDEADAVALEFDIARAELPHAPSCEFLDVWFSGIDGSRLHAKYIRRASRLADGSVTSDSSNPLVLQFHGYPGSSRSWFEQCSFVGMGMSVLALDCPGQGGSSQDLGGYPGPTVSGHIIAGLSGDPAELYYVRLHQDIRIMMRIVQTCPEFAHSRLFVNGASQGGALGLATCALNRDAIDRAAILYPFLSDFRLVWDLGADDIAYEGLRYFTRWFDAEGGDIDRAFGSLAYIDTKNFAHMVSCPVLFGTGTADSVCPVATQFAVFNNLDCEKRHEFFEGFGHEEIQSFDDMIIAFFCEAM